MTNVKRFNPTAQALENIPHMLRYWADVIECDKEQGIEADLAVLVLVNHGDPTPGFFTAGTPHSAPHHPLFVAGVLDYCRTRMVSVVEDEK